MLSPMMKQYLETKEQNPDALLFYQVGDFFEMFFEDAITTSKVLELTLTGKDCGLEERAPMCGIPIHAVDNYLPKLVQAGYKVALCTQGEVIPGSKELVKRSIAKIVTPGTLTDLIDDKKNNYIACIAKNKDDLALAYADISTGWLGLIKLSNTKELEDSLTRIRPSEIIVNQEAKEIEHHIQGINLGVIPAFSLYSQPAFAFSRAEKLCLKHFMVNSLLVFDVTSELKIGVQAVGALLDYLNETQKRVLYNINKITVEKQINFMHLDSNTRRNLELTENMTTKKKRGSLLGLLDKTKTSMGARMIRSFIEQPVISSTEINNRLDGVEDLLSHKMFMAELGERLSSVYDIERITGKIAYGSIMPKECLSLAQSLQKALTVKTLLLEKSNSKVLAECGALIDDGLDAIQQKLTSAIVENPPINLKDGGYIKLGYDPTLDDYLRASNMGKQWLVALESKIKEDTGIKTLKIAYNRVFGYYIEVSKTQISMVPASWSRRQTTTTGERYINEELKQMEEKILGSEELAQKLEVKLYSELKDYLKSHIKLLQQASQAIAKADALLSLAVVAEEYGFVRPIINDSIQKIDITDGRHPVVESLLTNTSFVPNDTILDCAENRTMIITGPNMAGKSTYMRQVALITLMAHIGSFVPAKKAEIALTDRIFTRIGASDDLAFGQSTFMVEMTEVANILHNATTKSLLILDEIGRGTSTYDGLSIAWAVLEYLSKNLSAKTLFATHYHELTDLEGKIEGVKNYRVLIKELNDSIVFLHKIARGSANKSFGIEVAELAGLPKDIITRAKEILKLQEEANHSATMSSFSESAVSNSKTKQNLNVSEVISVLSDIDMNTISPLVAFSTLQNLVDKVQK